MPSEQCEWVDDELTLRIDLKQNANSEQTEQSEGTQAWVVLRVKLFVFWTNIIPLLNHWWKGVSLSMMSRDVMRVYFQAQTVEYIRVVIDKRLQFCDLSRKAIVQMGKC